MAPHSSNVAWKIPWMEVEDLGRILTGKIWVHPGNCDLQGMPDMVLSVWKQLECPLMGGWLKEMRSAHEMEQYPALKRLKNLDICDKADEL